MPRPLADAWRSRPLLSAAALYIAGLAAHPHLPARPGTFLLLACGLTAAPLLPRLGDLLANTLLSAALFLAGAAAGQLASFAYPGDEIAHFTAEEPRLAQLEVEIETVPRLLPGAAGLPPRQVARARIQRLLTRSGWRPASGLLLLDLRPPAADLAIRQRVRLLGLLQRPPPAANPGQFDWSGHYRRQRLLASLQVPAPPQLLADPGPTPLDRLRAAARSALAAGFPADLDHALLRALVLGDTDPQLREVQEAFLRTGTSHHLAISGLHIAVLGGAVYFLCRLLLLRPPHATAIALALVLLYGAVALPSPPVVRSVLLGLALGLGRLGRRSIDGIHLLSLGLLLMLVHDPLDLYSAGFQLSFGTVLGLLTLTPPLAARLLRPDPDTAAAGPLAPLPLPRRLWRPTVQILAPALVASAVAAPLVACHFHQFNPWGIPATLLLAPPVFLALLAGLAKIVLTLLFPGLAPLLAPLAAWPVRMMRALVQALERLPGTDLPMPPFPPWGVGLYYLLLLLPLLPGGGPRVRWVLRCLPGVALALLLALPPLLAPRASPQRPLRLALLSVGAGQCAVVHLPSGANLLIDAGSATQQDLCRNVIEPYLRQRGEASVDAIVLSHANLDHFSAARDAAARLGGPLWTTPQFLAHARRNGPAQALLAQLPRPPEMLQAGMQLDLDASTRLEVLWPPPQLEIDPNNASLVLRLTCRGQSILFTGDIQEAAQRELLKDPERLHADVLVAPHHGSRESTTAAFIEAVHPGVILCSNGRRLSQKQRRFEAMSLPGEVFRTHASGALLVDLLPPGEVRLQTHR